MNKVAYSEKLYMVQSPQSVLPRLCYCQIKPLRCYRKPLREILFDRCTRTECVQHLSSLQIFKNCRASRCLVIEIGLHCGIYLVYKDQVKYGKNPATYGRIGNLWHHLWRNIQDTPDDPEIPGICVTSLQRHNYVTISVPNKSFLNIVMPRISARGLIQFSKL